MTKIVASYRYIPFGTKVNIVITNDITEAIKLYDKDYDEALDYSTWIASFIEGEGSCCYLVFKPNLTISDIIHETTHMVQFVMKYHFVHLADDYDENMAYGISYWSELVIATLIKETENISPWVKEQAQIQIYDSVGNMPQL